MKAKLLNFTLSFLLLSLIGVSTCFGQEIKRYDGNLKIASYKGNAYYNYFLKNGDSIKTGPFLFNSKQGTELDTNPFMISGSFKEGLPDGKWEFKFGNYSLQAEKKFVDYQYVVQVNGVQRHITGSFKNGIPTGDWFIEIDSLKNSAKTTSLFKSKVSFKDGIPQQSFRIENTDSYMIGRLLRNGDAHDSWSLFTKDGIDELENWKFDKGTLQEITQYRDSVENKLSIPANIKVAEKSIYLDQHYIEVLKLSLMDKNSGLQLDAGLSKLLKTNARHYHHIEDIFKNLDLNILLTNISVNVPEYPIAEQEEQQFSKINTNYKQSKEIIDFLLSDTQVNLLKLRDSVIKNQYEYVGHLQEQYVNPIEKLMVYHNESITKHIQRPVLIKGLFNDEQSLASTMVMGDPELPHLKLEKYDLTEVTDLSDRLLETLRILQQKLDGQVLKTNKEDKYIHQEKGLIEQANLVKNAVDSVQKKDHSKNVRKALESVNEFIDQTLTAYSVMSESEQKIRRSEELITCYKNAIELTHTLSQLDQEHKKIKKLYQDQVWNPFTATIMDEDVKKKITKAYFKEISPYLISIVKKDMSCEDITMIDNTFKELDARLTLLREEDTERLERKIKRTKDPTSLLQLFGLIQQQP
ncbi:hypothetical protein [Nonlabens sp. Asnod3-A02]|uniref:hypothetical protein n=1 Tax=Nonlabens sp. Asnod3-A02 TaxID=3160579 RepID=UPI00386E81AE